MNSLESSSCHSSERYSAKPLVLFSDSFHDQVREQIHDKRDTKQDDTNDKQNLVVIVPRDRFPQLGRNRGRQRPDGIDPFDQPQKGAVCRIPWRRATIISTATRLKPPSGTITSA